MIIPVLGLKLLVLCLLASVALLDLLMQATSRAWPRPSKDSVDGASSKPGDGELKAPVTAVFRETADVNPCR